MISAAADDAERCLHRVWQELTACGFVIDEPASLPPAPGPGLALKDAAAQMLAACGMMARPAGIRYRHPGSGQAPEVHTEVVVRNLARRARGYARITGEGTILMAMPVRRPRKPGQRAGPSRRRPGHRRRPPAQLPRRRQRRHPGQQHQAGQHGGTDLTEAPS